MNRKIPAITAFTLLMALLLTVGRQAPQTRMAMAYTENAPRVKTVYLTFDDGPSDRITPQILDVLKRENVPATFFIIGKQAELRPYLLQRAKAEGHTIAVHTYSHEYKRIYATPESLLADIDKCNDVIETATGERTNVYRFPGGSYGLSPKLINAVTGHGMHYVDWNACCKDAELWQPTASQLVQATKETTGKHEHVVLLMHDSTHKQTTVDALPSIISFYKTNGFTFEKF